VSRAIKKIEGEKESDIARPGPIRPCSKRCAKRVWAQRQLLWNDKLLTKF